MNTKATQKDGMDENSGESDQYLSPIAQQAKSIRNWRNRLEQRRSQERRQENHALVNSAYLR